MWKKKGKIPWEKVGRKYHMVYGIVPYGIGIVPYGIWYCTIRYWASRVEKLHVCVKRRLASFTISMSIVKSPVVQVRCSKRRVPLSYPSLPTRLN